MKTIDGHPIADNLYDKVIALKAKAAKVGIKLTVGGGTRLRSDQVRLRVKNVVDKARTKDTIYINTQPVSVQWPPKKEDQERLKGGRKEESSRDSKGNPIYRYFYFWPATAKPGTSNHEADENGDADAVDYNVTGFPDVYKWLVENAHLDGWIRTVPTERWHWEYRPGQDRFSIVGKNHSTWDNLL